MIKEMSQNCDHISIDYDYYRVPDSKYQLYELDFCFWKLEAR